MANLRVDKITSTEIFETTGSVQFDGSGDYLELPDSAGFSSSDLYTIELWIYNPEVVSGSAPFFTLGTGSAGQGFSLDYTSTPALRLDYYSNSISYNVDLQDSQWHHISASFDGTTRRLFLDGTLVAQDNLTGSYTAQNVVIGRMPWVSRVYKGHISNLRILKGQALYTSNFTPPTRELEVIPNTVLLACQSTTNAAEEKTGKTITVNGNAVANELTPGLLTNVVKSGGSSAITGSVEFDGTGDYLTIPNTEDLRLADSDFTIELWATISKVDSTYSPFALFENSTALRSYQLEVRSNGAVRFEWWYNGSSANDITTGTGAVIVNEWYHYAVSRNGATLKLFINGIEVGSSDVGTNSFFNNTVTPFIIGGMFQSGVQQQKWQGNISNFRIIKGTALYTSDFIPPTRKLTKLPGTVLLCCQDSDNPLTEATGKTITGYGDLQKADGVELVTNGTFSDGTTGWSQDSSPATFEVTGGRLHIVSNSNGDGAKQNVNLVVGAIYTLRFDYEVSIASIYDGNGIQWANQYGGDVSGSGSVEYTFTATTVSNDIEFIEGGPSNNADFYIDNVSLTLYDPPNRASNFTPSVGSDGSVEFAGPTTINTENYFYLPTGPTEQRYSGAGVRGVIMGGQAGSQIEYITISSQSNALDFGDLSVNRTANTAASSTTRGISAGGFSTPASSDVIDYVTIASTGDAQDFGDLTEARRNLCGLSNSTRGIFGGGTDPGLLNTIDYITIPSAGTAQDFGNLTTALVNLSACSSPTRGIIGGGESPGAVNTIQYITIPSKGDTQDFGDLTGVRSRMGSCSSNTRGLFGSGRTPAQVNTIDYVTIASTGNAQDFGDVIDARESLDGTSDNTRGIFAGGYPNTNTNLIEFVIIQSMGSAFDFGDLITPTREFGACSNGHGGLG